MAERLGDKDAPELTPSWVRTERIYSKEAGREIRCFIANDLDTLRSLANLGTIPLHLWSVRLGSLERPDWFVPDLDPTGAPYSHESARTFARLPALLAVEAAPGRAIARIGQRLRRTGSR